MGREREALTIAQQFIKDAGFSYSKKRFTTAEPHVRTEAYRLIYTFLDAGINTGKKCWYSKHEISLQVTPNSLNNLGLGDISYEADIVKPEMSLEPLENMLFEIAESNKSLSDYSFMAGFFGDAKDFEKEPIAPIIMAANSSVLDTRYLSKAIGTIDSMIAIYFGIDTRR